MSDVARAKGCPEIAEEIVAYYAGICLSFNLTDLPLKHRLAEAIALRMSAHSNAFAAEQTEGREDRVHVLEAALRNILYAQLGGHLNPTAVGKKVLDAVRSLVPDE